MTGADGVTFDLLGPYALRRGFPWKLELCRKNPDGEPMDLTGSTCRLEIFRSLSVPEPLCSSEPRRAMSWDFSPAAALGGDGLIRFHLSETETAAIAASAARYRLVFTDASGEPSVLAEGRLAVLEER